MRVNPALVADDLRHLALRSRCGRQLGVDAFSRRAARRRLRIHRLPSLRAVRRAIHRAGPRALARRQVGAHLGALAIHRPAEQEGAFDSGIGFALLSRLAEQRARVVALSDDPTRARDQQLLHLARLASGNDQLYIERVIAPETFAADWERIGARRRGPIGEALGRQTVDSLIVVLREGIGHDEATRAWALIEALESSLSTPAPRTSDGIDPGAGAGLVRVLTVVPSPFYAAAARRSDARPTDDASLSLHFAAMSQAAQRRFDRLRAAKPTLNRLIYLAAAPGLTRSALTRFLAPRPKRWLDLRWPRWLVVMPGAWLCGQDSSRAARGIDWTLRAPLQLIKDGALVQGIRPGALYRDGKECAGLLAHI